MKASDRLIQHPPRSSLVGTIVIIIAVILLSIIPFSPRMSSGAAAVAALLAIIAVLRREIQAFHLVLLAVALTAIPSLHSSLQGWPISLLVPILLYLAIVLMIPRYRRSILWLRIGRIGKDTLFLVLAVSVISGIALYIWFRALNPDLSIHLKYMPHMPYWLFPLAGLGFSAFNAAMEETVFRGVVMQALDSAFGPGTMSIVVQAWLFGSMHYREGFPNGALGLAMTFIYGIMLGALRSRSMGLLAPWIAHVCADIVIFVILAGLLPGQ